MLLLETIVDLPRFHGGVYRAANWMELGLTQGYGRTRQGYSDQACAPTESLFAGYVAIRAHDAPTLTAITLNSPALPKSSSMPTRCARCRGASR